MAAAPSVEQRFSLFLCDRVGSAVTGATFLPEHTTGEQLGADPFFVPLIERCDQVNPPDEVFLLHVNLTLQTMPDDTTAEIHSDLVRQAKAALEELRRLLPGYDENREVFVSGMAILGVRPIMSDQARVTAIELRAGCQIRVPDTATT